MSAYERLKILLVDSNSALRRVTKSILRQLNVTRLFEADSAETAWKILDKDKADLIISEWNLPGQSGLDFLRTIREHAELKDTRFIVITSDTGQENIVNALSSKISSHIIRPFSADALSKKIDELFEHKSEPVQNDSPFDRDNLDSIDEVSQRQTSEFLDDKELSDIEIIIRSGNIQTHFHPIISFKDKAIIGFEALSRGFRKEGGEFIYPGAMFKMAAEKNLTARLDALCREKAIRTFAPIYAKNKKLFLSINIDTGNINEGVKRLDDLMILCRDMNISPRNIILDVFEAGARDDQSLLAFIAVHKKLGFRIALDNVGAVTVNFDRLTLTKPDMIKIDKKLIAGVDQDYYKQEIVKALIGISEKLGAQTVAIGVEREEEILSTLNYGIQTLQGFYFTVPKNRGNLAEHFDRQISALSATFTEYSLKKIMAHKEKYETLNTFSTSLAAKLSEADPQVFETLLTEVAGQEENYTFYILNAEGKQITPPISAMLAKGERGGILGRLSPKGENHCLKNYYLHIKAGYGLFVTEAYSSPVSGLLCETLAVGFTSQNEEKYILCLDTKSG